MNVKELFDNAENGTLTYEQFQQAATEANAKFTDLNEGKYVSKSKYESDLKSKDSQITTLNETISTRDTDLATLKTQLAEAGTDTAKLTKVNEDLTALQGRYDADTKALNDRLIKQQYEFAVKEFANTKKFTSSAAKRDFINSMIAKNLQIDNDKILGAEDFVSAYTADNEDAFVVEAPAPEPQPAQPKAPKFVSPTPGAEPKDESGFRFSFTGVRAHE